MIDPPFGVTWDGDTLSRVYWTLTASEYSGAKRADGLDAEEAMRGVGAGEGAEDGRTVGSDR